MKQKFSLVCFILLICVSFTNVRAQFIDDSLSARLTQKNLAPEERVTTMALLARAKSVANIKSAMRIAEKALALSRQLPDAKYTAFVYTHLVFLHFINEELPQALYAADSAIWYADKTSDMTTKGFAWFRKGWLQDVQGNDHESMKTYLQALKYLEGTDAYTYQSFVYYNMAGTYAAWDDLVNQKKYALLALKSARQSHDLDELASAYQAMATSYHYTYKKQIKNKALLDSALFYNKLGIKLFSEHWDHMIIKSTAAVIALNTAELYEQYFPASYKDTAWSYLQIARNTALQTRQLSVLSACYAMMSDFEIEKGNYKKAEELLLTGLQVFQSYTVDNPRSMAQFMDALSRLYEKMGNPSAALKYYKEFYAQSKLLYDVDKLEITNRLEAQYQSEKKEAALKTLSHTAALNKKLNYLYISLVIAAIIALLFIVRFFQVRLKATLHQQKLLENENAAASLHARLKEEEALRLKAEQLLLQERQERLQKELLAGSLQVEQKDELLQTLQKKIDEHKTGDRVLTQINQIIDQHKRLDDSQAAQKADFDNIRPEFFEKLKEKSGNTLSRLDLKHCSYISLGLTNKEIAQRLGVAPKSILMSRYRIKIKLGLSKEEDLDEYIGTVK